MLRLTHKVLEAVSLAQAKLGLTNIELEYYIHADWLISHGYLKCTHEKQDTRTFSDGSERNHCKLCGMPKPPQYLPPPSFNESEFGQEFFKWCKEKPLINMKDKKMLASHAKKKIELGQQYQAKYGVSAFSVQDEEMYKKEAGE